MQYRTLGKTGLKVSALAFGGSALGSTFRSINESEGIKAVHTAVDHGINLIDTAPYYGGTTAETVLGKALREIPREQYLLATKVARYGPKFEDFDFSAARVIRSVDESLARMNVDYVDFVQVHDVEFGDISQIVNETIPALHQVRDQGKACFVGISCLPVNLFQRVMDQVAVDQIQSYRNDCLNDTALADTLPDLRERGVAIFNSAPLGMRLLGDAGPPKWHPATQELRAKCTEAAELCRSRGTPIGRLALQFSLANPEIHTNIVGTASPSRVLENIRDAEVPPDRELLRDVLAILEPVHNLTWPSGHPENN